MTNTAHNANCAHTLTRMEKLPPGSLHYAQIVCASCGKLLSYKANPTNVERRQSNAANIRKLLGSNRMTEWERGFCLGLKHNQRPATWQQAQLDELVKKYLLQGEAIYNAQPKGNGALRYECAV